MDNAVYKMALILAKMDDYIRDNIEDEDVFEEWLAEGVPDGTEEYAWMAENEEIFKDIVTCFVRLASIAEFTDIVNDVLDDSDVIIKEDK